MILSLTSSVVTSDEDNAMIEPEGTRQSFTHTVLAEDITAEWCVFCPAASEALDSIYESNDYDFYFVSMITENMDRETLNDDAQQRADDYNIGSYPTVMFDGGYEEVIGAGDGVESDYRDAIESCGARTVPDIDLILTAETLGDAELEIGVQITNNDGSDYSGHLRVYITEIYSRYDDYDGNPYPYAFLDYAFDEDISIPSANYYENSVIWDGAYNQDALGNDFGDIDPNNIMIIGAVFNSERNIEYHPTTPPKVYDAYFLDEAAGVIPGEGGSNGEDTTPPSITITSPDDNEVVQGNVIIEATVTDNVELQNVQYRIDNGLWELMFFKTPDPDTDPKYYYSEWDTTIFNNDVYTITVRATDSSYNSNEKSITVTVSNSNEDYEDPQISFVTPINGDTIGGSTTIKVEVTDDVGINYVQYSIDFGDWKAMTRKGTTTYEAQLNTGSLEDGAHTLSIKAVDSSNNEERQEITLYSDNTLNDEESTPGFELGIMIVSLLVVIILISRSRKMK
jgi:thiol-disulfide isomerase/thioredoxin